MLAKIISVRRVFLFFALAILVSGCSPNGPRALLKGKKFLDRGDDAAAVEQLKIATTLLATNAQAWNYYGVALQHVGDATNAANAYGRALDLNRDLVEAHFNLGSLWLEQNKPAEAKTEFTAYTLRRSNDPAGWLKLGSAQLKLNETAAAEKSFSTALYLNPNNAEAYNGLGLARIQRGRSRDAAQFFAAAVQYHPDFAPAILNLATVNRDYLHDNKAALENYRAYLALTPRPANWDEVNAIANSLEQPAVVASANPSPKKTVEPENKSVTTESKSITQENKNSAPAPTVVETKKVETAQSHPQIVTRQQPPPKTSYTPPPREISTASATVVKSQMVEVAPEQPIVTKTPAVTNKLIVHAPVEEQPVEMPPAESESSKKSFWQKVNPRNWFGTTTPVKNVASETPPENVTPLPSPGEVSKPVKIIQPAPDVSPAPQKMESQVVVAPAVAPVFPRYHFISPRKPSAGDRTAARGAFTKAQVYEQAGDWPNVLQWYAQAVQYDPSWFEAQYNLGVVAYQLRDYQQALSADEMALAIRPDSADARYNFALALTAAGYAPDAADELKKVIAANPNDVRAHLTLGNLYAQQLHDSARARPEYLEVLKLDPNHPQASNIRFWLSANP